MARLLSLLIPLSLLSCASGLQYKPDRAVSGARITADYTVLDRDLQVQVDTDGHRLEQALIVLDDGSTVEPRDIVHAPVGGGAGVGIGVGGGTRGVGAGVGVGGSPTRAHSYTTVYFDRNRIGAAPWTFHVKLVSFPSTTITLPLR